MNNFLILGHRGSGSKQSGSLYYENSIDSALAALNSGADGVEIDVQITSDGVPVLFHDWLINHEGVEIPICKIDSVDFLSINSHHTTLKNFLYNISIRKFYVDLEIKYPTLQDFKDDLLHKSDYVLSDWPSMKDFANIVLEVLKCSIGTIQVFISSFNFELCKIIRSYSSQIEVYLLYSGKEYFSTETSDLDGVINLIYENNITGLIFDSSLLKDVLRLLPEMIRKNIKSYSYGHLNNIPNIVDEQKASKLNGVIVDKVEEICKHCEHYFS